MATKSLALPSLPPPPEPIGTVIAMPNGSSPNVLEYHCILSGSDRDSNLRIRQGQFCVTNSLEGLVIGRVDHLQILNSYFQDAQTIKNFSDSQINLREYFPSDRWECHIAQIMVLGIVPNIFQFSYQLDPLQFRRLEKPGFPVKPGNNVYLMDGEFLRNFLGIDDKGLNVGELKYYPIPVRLDMNRLFNKHLAILAQSGAGKSYLISVLLEEILMRDEKLGRPGLVLFDVHGEYRYMSERLDATSCPDLKRRMDLEDIQRRIQHYNASFLQIGVPNLSEYDFQKFQPGISLPQLRVLRKAIDICRRKFRNFKQNSDPSINTPPPEGFDLKDLIFVINDDAEINPKVKETLVAWLADLDYMNIFTKTESPAVTQLVRPGMLSILDLSTITSMRKKQMLVHYFATRMFNSRRSGIICPFVAFLEESHNFIPESGGNNAIAKGIFETIAREGRKFYAQIVLISQRPVQLSTTVLSQCSTQIVMRITNPYDLDHIRKTCETLSAEGVKVITTLPTGNGVIIGAALNYPVFFKVRTRFIPSIKAETSLAEMCSEFQKKEYLNTFTGLPGHISEDELMDMDYTIVKE